MYSFLLLRQVLELLFIGRVIKFASRLALTVKSVIIVDALLFHSPFVLSTELGYQAIMTWMMQERAILVIRDMPVPVPVVAIPVQPLMSLASIVEQENKKCQVS